ncbi:Urm1 (Ubiquitin related modifier) family protein [Theileria parva strain Muguga]|uniref:Ubiquitin-related modifier 1 homolog n=1 Tax=Theileria parva TaxID=5875 RepID=Q4N3Y6_THEPA|nr:Urm1 (Ubiquitin related modifier) family protein [Theileria parva strain Muguga]EAN33137.1 Urm1 (Ubiquitin related modifier) family protein [Theileria parva strain Muguga]|eukprot:XP_765420.1 hypothetical protein [Theileria parva strain Muguga]
MDESVTVVTLEFSGGLDSLVIDQEKELTLKIFSKNINLGQLICYIRNHIIGSKKDFFSISTDHTGNSDNNSGNTEESEAKSEETEGKSEETECKSVLIECNISRYNGRLNSREKCKIRPGVLVLVNNTDWELLNKENTILKNHDLISFISTLHGG